MANLGQQGKKDIAQDVSQAVRGNKTSKILVLIGIVLLAASLIGAGVIFWQYRSGDALYAGISKSNGSGQLTDTENQLTEAESLAYQLDIDWATLQGQNSDVVAWVQVPGTQINYPIVQTSDNNFYLTHDFTKSQSNFGCVFLDYESASGFSDKNSIFYGHNMLNGSMFHDFVEYTDATFLSEHPYVYLATPADGTVCLKVFAYVVASGDEELRQTSFASDEEFTAYVQAALDRNEITTDVQAVDVKHLYTFATCSYQFNDARTLIYAVRVDEYGNMVSDDENVS